MTLPATWSVGAVAASRIADTDLDDLVELHRDPVVMDHIGGVRDTDTTRAYLQTNQDHWSEHGFGLYALRHPDGAFVGRAGLRTAEPLGRPEIEVAYALAARWWGRGYAVTVTEKLCSLAADADLTAEVVAFTETTNRQSWRVMEKARFTFDRHFTYHGIPHVLYRRTLGLPG